MAGVQAPRCSAGPSTEARRLPAQQQRGAARCAAAKPVGSRGRRPAHSDALLSGCERRTWLPLSALHFELVRALWGGPEAASRGAGSWAPGVSRRVWMRGEGSTGRRVRAGETWGRGLNRGREPRQTPRGGFREKDLVVTPALRPRGTREPPLSSQALRFPHLLSQKI